MMVVLYDAIESNAQHIFFRIDFHLHGKVPAGDCLGRLRLPLDILQHGLEGLHQFANFVVCQDPDVCGGISYRQLFCDAVQDS
ncbi:hypothetical protein SDC9_118140 [bioreactor metagenome]|uniref:Uncharacterized protein n=1 Tax=bioreactor metagenome TaxID=1076179 RepID=A0A645C1H9_9ZZZZ